MKFFLDTCNVDEIIEFVNLGLIEGVTSNWRIARETEMSVSAFIRNLTAQYTLEHPLEISYQPNSKYSDYFEDTYTLFKVYEGINKNISLVPKVPMSYDYMDCAKKFVNVGIDINATMIVEPWQAYLAGEIGARYVSIFVSRILKNAHNIEEGWKIIENMHSICENYEHSQVIFASIKTREQFNRIVCEYGLYAMPIVITIPPKLFRSILDAPRVREIFEDWESPPKHSLSTKISDFLKAL